MKRTHGTEPELSTEDRRLVDAIDAAFGPEPMSPTRRVEFRATLDERIARRARGGRWLAPALASTAVLALWLARPDVTPTSSPSLASAELYAFIEPDAESGAIDESRFYLPDDYRALAALYEGDDSAR